jgi:dTDP-4-dehydrorhamnose 3,5-epimerase and related enzymes
MGKVASFTTPCNDIGGIEGLHLAGLGEIAAEGGPVLHMVRKDSPLFTGFGEVYFSEVEPGMVKAWKRHQRQTQLFAVPHGLVDIIVFDSREDSPARGKLVHVRLGRPGHYRLLRVPPRLWYGFCSCGGGAILCNCADIPHDPEESERLPVNSPELPFSWKDWLER